MHYALILSKKTQKALKRIDPRYLVRIHAALLELTTNPQLGKPLKGEYDGLWSLRVWPYRILYSINHREVLILIVDIGHRQGIYR